jgi:hypothetical protein
MFFSNKNPSKVHSIITYPVLILDIGDWHDLYSDDDVNQKKAQMV